MNTEGSYRCICPDNLTLDPTGTQCVGQYRLIQIWNYMSSTERQSQGSKAKNQNKSANQ